MDTAPGGAPAGEGSFTHAVGGTAPVPDKRDSLNEIQKRKRDLHESRTSAAPRSSQSPAASIPLSLRSAMQEEAQKIGLDMAFATAQWWKELNGLLTKDGASETAVLENWRLCLSGKVKVDKTGKTVAGKERFFVEDYSQCSGPIILDWDMRSLRPPVR